MDLEKELKLMIAKEFIKRKENDMNNLEIVASISREETLKEVAYIMTYEDEKQ